MIQLSMLKTVHPNSSDRKSHKQGDAEPACQPTSLLSFLEMENVRLRQAVTELSLHVRALRDALKRMEATSLLADVPERASSVGPLNIIGLSSLPAPRRILDR
jgi:hypothetical protein